MESVATTRPEFVEIHIVDTYTREDRNLLADGHEDPHQTSSDGLEWRRTEKHVLVYERSEMACHVGLLKHTVEVGLEHLEVGGIGGVLTRREFRGRGYARIAIAAAQEFAQEQWGVNFLVLFCRPALEAWYQLLGWSKISEAVWVDQEKTSLVMPLVTMVKPLGAARWPCGAVWLKSLPW
jgi:aminoglycoside 2'-N-acetyltransferase I